MKKFLLVFFFGATVGAVVASFLGPKFIAWYFEPPVYVGVSCQNAALWAVQTYQKVQLVSLAVGGVFITAVFYALFRGKKTNATDVKEIRPN